MGKFVVRGRPSYLWPVRHSVFVQVGGLIAVGQRLAPVGPYILSEGGNSREFFPGGDVFGRHTSSSHRRSEHDVDPRHLQQAPTSIRLGESPSIDVSYT